jgi:hypothetical protein
LHVAQEQLGLFELAATLARDEHRIASHRVGADAVGAQVIEERERNRPLLACGA